MAKMRLAKIKMRLALAQNPACISDFAGCISDFASRIFCSSVSSVQFPEVHELNHPIKPSPSASQSPFFFFRRRGWG